MRRRSAAPPSPWRLAEHADLAGGRADDVEQQSHRRGLAGAVRADHAEDHARGGCRGRCRAGQGSSRSAWSGRASRRRRWIRSWPGPSKRRVTTDATVSAPSVGVGSTVPRRIGVLVRVSWSLVGARCAPRRRDTAERLVGGVEHPGVGVEAVGVELEHGPGHPPKRRRTRKRRAQRARQLIAQEQWSETVDGDDQGPHLGIGGCLASSRRRRRRRASPPCRGRGDRRAGCLPRCRRPASSRSSRCRRGSARGRRATPGSWRRPRAPRLPGLLADELRREPLVARLPQGLLRPEVVNDEGRAHAGVGGDIAHARAGEPLRAEPGDRRVPNASRRRLVLERD